ARVAVAYLLSPRLLGVQPLALRPCAAGVRRRAGEHATLPVELGGLVVVKHDVRRPAAYPWVRASLHCWDPLPVLPVAVIDAVIARHAAAVGSEQLRACTVPIDVQRPGAVREDVRRDSPGERLAADDDRLERGLERGAPSLPLLGLVGARLDERLADVERLREARPVQPRDRVANLEPSVLDRDREPVPRARAAEREEVPARLEHP